jgi:hypothetical protein
VGVEEEGGEASPGGHAQGGVVGNKAKSVFSQTSDPIMEPFSDKENHVQRENSHLETTTLLRGEPREESAVA